MMEYFWPLAMLIGLIVGIFTGYPVALTLAGLGIGFAVLADVPMLFLSMSVQRIYSGTLTNWLLIAIPLFVFMGLMLERSGVAERLMKSLASLFKGLPGGYAFAVSIIGVIMAASTGIIGASVVLMGMMAMPAMREAKYDMRLASGLIASSATLGILLPPSIMLIILGDQLQVSIGDLFMGAIYPGLLLAGLYMAYLIVVAIVSPHKMPAPAQHDPEPLGKVLLSLLRDLVAPLALILSVLGTIIAGFATPTESAAVGAIGALLLALLSRQLSWNALRRSIWETATTTAMIAFVMIGASIFSMVFRRLGGDGMIADMFNIDEANPWMIFAIIMGIVFILGFFLDWVEICLVVVPIVAPIIASLDFGMSKEFALIWFAVTLAVNLQTSFLTPPFGYALFYLRGVAPDLPISTIYRGIIPFVLLQIAGLALCVIFPQIVLSLPMGMR